MEEVCECADVARLAQVEVLNNQMAVTTVGCNNSAVARYTQIHHLWRIMSMIYDGYYNPFARAQMEIGGPLGV